MDAVRRDGIQRRLQDARSRRCGSFGLRAMIFLFRLYVQMYTYLLLLSSLFSFKAFTDDDAILAQSAAGFGYGRCLCSFSSPAVNGLWATRTPAIRDLLALSTAEMGVVLFGLSVGSMRRYSLLGVAGEALWYPQGHPHHLCPSPCLACWCSAWRYGSLPPPLFAFGLAIFGASFGSAEVAINVEGARPSSGR